MLNRIHEKGMTKNHRGKVSIYRVAVVQRFWKSVSKASLDQLVKIKPVCLIVHAGTNDLADGTNLLNKTKQKINKKKKIATQVKNFSKNTKIVFSSIMIRKVRKNMNKKVSQVNS